MQHTSQQIIALAKKVWSELQYDFYLEETLRPFNTTEDEWVKKAVLEDFFKINYPSQNVWFVYANIKSQFGGNDGILSMEIDDDTLEPISMYDGSGGRIPPLKIGKKDGKYAIVARLGDY